jgi:hypothetical protein
MRCFAWLATADLDDLGGDVQRLQLANAVEKRSV